MKIIYKIKKTKAHQIVAEIQEQEDNKFVGRFLIPVVAGTHEENSSYMYELKRPTYYNLKKIINENKNEPYLSFWITSVDLNSLESGIAACESISKEVGLNNFLFLADLPFPEFGYNQHLYWAGIDKHVGKETYDSDFVKKDGSINWKEEGHRIKEELKTVILNYFEGHPEELLDSLTLHAVEHVGILINDRGPDGFDYLSTNIYTVDIEDFVQKNGFAEYHKCLDTALKLLRKDKEVKRLFKKSTNLAINT